MPNPKGNPLLKKYQWKKGEAPGRPKGARSKRAELTAEILVEAFLVNPDTGSRMTAKQLRYMLSKKIWKGSDKVLLDVIARKLGPVINTATIVQVPTFNIISQGEVPKALENGEHNIETYTIPGTDEDTSSDND